MNYLIENDQQLRELEQKIEISFKDGGVVAVDTEFLREKTYYAQLCVLQLGFDGDQYCIDMLALSDFEKIKQLLTNSKVLKLFHAARQDMEVLYQTLKVMPQPIFDTQLAAAFCGMDMQVGYAGLVKTVLDVELAKSETRTNWSLRPLTPKQIDYAADDVAYLHQLYERTHQDLQDQNKLDWYQQEIQEYYQLEKYFIDPAQAYQRLNGGNFDLHAQYLLQAFAEWRESYAQQRDIPRTWVLRDEFIYQLADQAPKSLEQLAKSEILTNKTLDRWGEKIIQIINGVKVEAQPLWRKAEPLSKLEKQQCSELMVQLKNISQQHNIAQGLLATRKTVESLYRHGTSSKLESGWRNDLVATPLKTYLAKFK